MDVCRDCWATVTCVSRVTFSHGTASAENYNRFCIYSICLSSFSPLEHLQLHGNPPVYCSSWQVAWVPVESQGPHQNLKYGPVSQSSRVTVGKCALRDLDYNTSKKDDKKKILMAWRFYKERGKRVRIPLPLTESGFMPCLGRFQF